MTIGQQWLRYAMHPILSYLLSWSVVVYYLYCIIALQFYTEVIRQIMDKRKGEMPANLAVGDVSVPSLMHVSLTRSSLCPSVCLSVRPSCCLQCMSCSVSGCLFVCLSVHPPVLLKLRSDQTFRCFKIWSLKPKGSLPALTKSRKLLPILEVEKRPKRSPIILWITAGSTRGWFLLSLGEIGCRNCNTWVRFIQSYV